VHALVGGSEPFTATPTWSIEDLQWARWQMALIDPSPQNRLPGENSHIITTPQPDSFGCPSLNLKDQIGLDDTF